MTLKKSDKIIAIIGVVILIIAGIGIYLYATSQEESKESMENGEKTKIFNIKYETKSETIDPYTKSYNIKPKLIGERKENHDVVINKQNIKSIEFFVEYEDNNRGLLFGRIAQTIGADTLTITIKDKDDKIVDTVKTIKGSGNATISTKDISSPVLDPIEAEDEDDALYILEERFIDYHETYTVTVTLKAGLWGRFREWLGYDSFGLEVTCEYYDYTLEPPENENNLGDDEDNNNTGSNKGTGVYTIINLPLTKL